MNSKLADRLLAEVMHWEPEDVAQQRPLLQAMASYKYDEYQQFAPGMRFIESLAIWIGQFSDYEERRVAYNLVKNHLVFCSNAEMRHLVEIAYHDHIRPILMRRVGESLQIPWWRVAEIESTKEYQIAKRRSLYIGLSDGSRIDIFRRASRELSHEQILLIYDSLGNDERVRSVIGELRGDLRRITGEGQCQEKFNTLVLLDDFSASGMSYIRKGKDGTYTGKIYKLLRSIEDPGGGTSELVNLDELRLIVVLYIATERARRFLDEHLNAVLGTHGISVRIVVIQLLSDDVAITPGQYPALDSLLDAYYTEEFEDRHSEVGGSGIKYGFSGCGLPLVLSHNTPNNSIYVLWMDKAGFRGVFPRRSRHGAHL